MRSAETLRGNGGTAHARVTFQFDITLCVVSLVPEGGFGEGDLGAGARGPHGREAFFVVALERRERRRNKHRTAAGRRRQRGVFVVVDRRRRCLIARLGLLGRGHALLERELGRAALLGELADLAFERLVELGGELQARGTTRARICETPRRNPTPRLARLPARARALTSSATFLPEGASAPVPVPASWLAAPSPAAAAGGGAGSPVRHTATAARKSACAAASSYSPSSSEPAAAAGAGGAPPPAGANEKSASPPAAPPPPRRASSAANSAAMRAGSSTSASDAELWPPARHAATACWNSAAAAASS